jgi:hypothetical protein
MPILRHFLYLQAEQFLLDSFISQLPPVARQNNFAAIIKKNNILQNYSIPKLFNLRSFTFLHSGEMVAHSAFSFYHICERDAKSSHSHTHHLGL